MRGGDRKSGDLFSYVSIEERVPRHHPLRLIREIVNEVLEGLSADFSSVYSRLGRPSIPPEHLLRGLLLQAFYSIRSERQLMEQLNYNMLFRWFVGLGMDDAVWDASVFAKNRDRLLTQDVASKFLKGIITHERVAKLLSRDHFSVDGTLIEAWASMKSFSPRDERGEEGGVSRNREANFRGQKRKNDTHASTTDPAARLYRKGRGKSAQLCFMGHALMENRSGLAVAATVTHASGTAEREAALKMLECIERNPGATLGGDAAFDVWRFKSDLEALGIVPHMARRTDKSWGGLPFKSPPGYDLSLKHRKRIEEIFGWTKTVAGQAKTKFRGVGRVAASFVFAVAANNLIRLPKLIGASP